MKYTHDNIRIKLTGQDDNLQLEVYTLTKIIYANPRRKKKKKFVITPVSSTIMSLILNKGYFLLLI